MRKLIQLLLVASLLVLVTPGLTEAAENLWHLATTGHTAHSPDAGADHRPIDDEHGCTGSFHMCSCHRTPPSRTEARRRLADGDAVVGAAATRERTNWEDPFVSGLDHVPRS